MLCTTHRVGLAGRITVQNGRERGLRAHCQLRSVSEAAADLVLAPSTGVADGLARATVVLIERCRAVLTERCRRINS
jgi:hypothetical protein